MPKVSIITPCYNSGHFLPETIDSVLAQTFSDYEVIIVDDASNDGTTPAVIAEQAMRDKRIKLITHSKNKGLSTARNTAIKQAKGKYILALDSDDKLAPTFLEKTVATMESTDADAVYANFQYFGLRNSIRYFKDQKFLKRLMPYKACFPVWALYKKSDWEAIGGYDEKMFAGEDRDFWLHFVEADKNFALVDEVLFYYRTHKERLSSTTGKFKAKRDKMIRENHPNLYKGSQYYFNINYLKYVVRPALFQLRTRKGRRVFRLLGVTIYED